jgi:hypothetical protein
MPTLDWPDRPAASPAGGFLIQRRGGSRNFEVVFAWPDGGLAYFARDNGANPFTWHGPTLFGHGNYLGASVTESDFSTFLDSPVKNLEVAAVRENGTVEHWWMENGGAFVWHQAETILSGATGVPALVYGGSLFKEGPFGFDLNRHDAGELHLAVPNRGDGFSYLTKQIGIPDAISSATGQDPGVPMPWKNRGGPPATGLPVLADRQFVGAAIALVCSVNLYHQASWKTFREKDSRVLSANVLVAVVSDLGALAIYEWDEKQDFGAPGSVVVGWNDALSITTQTVFEGVTQQVLRPCRGRPSLIQGDYDLDDTVFFPFDNTRHYGNLELVAPSNTGGIHHLWRDCGSPDDEQQLDRIWRYATLIGTAMYDEVSLIQSNFGDADHGNLEMVARTDKQRGFDFYWRDEGFNWRGPVPIGPPGTTAAPLSVGTTVTPEDFVHWSTADPDGATGTLRDMSVTLTGPMGTAFYLHDDYPNFSSEAFTPPLAATGMVEIVGAAGHSFTLTFSAAIRDPQFMLGSLCSIMTFPSGVIVTRLSGDPTLQVVDNVVTGELKEAQPQPDGTLSPTDSNGTIRLNGQFASITFTLVANLPDQSIHDGVFLQLGASQAL